MTPYEQLLEDLLVERLRPTPPPPAKLPHLVDLPVEAAPELDVRRLVREVAPPQRRHNHGERMDRERLRRHAVVRAVALTDDEIEAI